MDDDQVSCLSERACLCLRNSECFFFFFFHFAFRLVCSAVQFKREKSYLIKELENIGGGVASGEAKENKEK